MTCGTTRPAWRAFCAGETDNYEVTKRYIRKDGSMFHGRLKVSVVKSDPSGERMYLRMVEDITTEVQAQEAIWQAEQRSRHIIERRHGAGADHRPGRADHLHEQGHRDVPGLVQR